MRKGIDSPGMMHYYFNHMKIVQISDVGPGVVLARDLKDSGGSLILSKGKELSKAMIERLARMNIQEVAIEGEDPESAEKMREKLAKLKHRFEGHEQDPFMSEIERIVREYFEQTVSMDS